MGEWGGGFDGLFLEIFYQGPKSEARSHANIILSLTQSDQVPILHKKKIQGLRMAAQNLPIIFKERLNLCNQFGLNAADINFKATTMESDKFICVKATAPQGQKPKLKIVNLATNAVQEFPMGADSAIMNPMSQIVAVRSGGKLRTLNLELQSNMKGKAPIILKLPSFPRFYLFLFFFQHC
jgi:hypothetical protein